MLTTSDKITVNLGTPRERREVFPIQINVSTGAEYIKAKNIECSNATISYTANISMATVLTLFGVNAYLTSAIVNVLTLSSESKPAAKASTCAAKGILTFDVGTSALYLSVATNKWVRVQLASWS